MPKKAPRRLPSDLPREKVRLAFERLGFAFDHQGGRHTILRDPRDSTRLVSLPRHARMKRDLLRGILRGVGVSEAEFMEHY